MEVQIFGIRKCADTRKAQRWFAERRVKTHFVDLQQRAASPGELKRFAERFGVGALVDREGKRFEQQGLRSAHLSDERWLARLADDPLLVRTPLVRMKQKLTIGYAPDEWSGWMEQGA
ncbi:MAG TPA: ArsC/Spx/MgsR family protein [Longimicrobiales bacterium]